MYRIFMIVIISPLPFPLDLWKAIDTQGLIIEIFPLTVHFLNSKRMSSVTSHESFPVYTRYNPRSITLQHSVTDLILVITQCTDKIREAVKLSLWIKAARVLITVIFCLVSLKESVILSKMSSMWQNKATKASCGSN